MLFRSKRPFRSPHHSSSMASIVGGGVFPKPGEISLSHRGILFLDEFPEFSRCVLESLRQPMEDFCVTISRAHGSFDFPAKFTLIASCNPCPCGYLNDSEKRCICSSGAIAKYRNKISGPIMDRIDMHINVPRINFEKLSDNNLQENSLTKLLLRSYCPMPFLYNSGKPFFSSKTCLNSCSQLLYNI